MNEFFKKAEDERVKHAAAIDRIAASLQVPREEVAPVYERVLAELQQNARIRTFLAIFAARRVEQLIRKMRGPFGSAPLESHS
jgi:hypothetical protein